MNLTDGQASNLRFAAERMGKNVEENTSKIYVGTAGLSPTGLNPMIAAAGAGSPLFVINLCASIAPVQTSGKNLPGLDNYRLYQVSRVEDGRTRHRLRLGFFTSESHAESVLTVVRQQYPTAFTACLCDEDRKFARGFLPDAATAAPMPAAKRPVSIVSTLAPAVQARQTPPPAAKPAAAPARPVVSKAAPTPSAARPAATRTSSEAEIIEVTWEPEPTAAARPAAATAASVLKQSALSSDAGLDEFTWEPPTLEPKAAGSSTSDTARHPVLAPVFKTQPVTKAAPAAKSTTDTSASMRVPALKLDAATSMRVPALKVGTAATSMRVPALKTDTAASTRVPVLKPDTAATTRVPALRIEPAASMRVPALKVDTSASMRVPALSLSEPAPASAPKSPTAAAPAQPFHVGKGVDIADLGISLESDLPTVSRTQKPAQKQDQKQDQKHDKPAAKNAAPVAKSVPAPAAKPTPATPAAPVKAASAAPKPTEPVHTPASAPAVANPIAAPAAPKAPFSIAALTGGALPDLDSTQTIRALTNDELNDNGQEKWFAIQLAASEQPVNLDAMPRLDIFEAYRLYSVASAGSGRIIHSLRLGFFKEAVSAEAVGGYLKTFFGAPSVLRVSVAEHSRFKDAPAPKKAAAAPAKSEGKVLEFNQARAGKPVIPTVTMEVSPAPAADTSASGSFKTSSSGSFKVGASGKHKALAAQKSGPTPKRSNGARPRTGNTGKYKALPPKSLSQQLLEEAREVELSESGIRKLPKNDSLLSRLVDKLKK